jgi:hypothetical protein
MESSQEPRLGLKRAYRLNQGTYKRKDDTSQPAEVYPHTKLRGFVTLYQILKQFFAVQRACAVLQAA